MSANVGQEDGRADEWRAAAMTWARVTSLGESAEDFAEFKSAVDYIGLHAMLKADAEVAGLRTQLAEAEAALSGVIDDYDRLAGQVDAIRALADTDALNALDAIRAVLAASTPTENKETTT